MLFFSLFWPILRNSRKYEESNTMNVYEEIDFSVVSIPLHNQWTFWRNLKTSWPLKKSTPVKRRNCEFTFIWQDKFHWNHRIRFTPLSFTIIQLNYKLPSSSKTYDVQKLKFSNLKCLKFCLNYNNIKSYIFTMWITIDYIDLLHENNWNISF